MNIKITNAELLNLYGVLSNSQIPGSPKFTYVLAKNRAILKPFAEALQEASQSYVKQNPKVQEYQKRTDELLKKFAVDDSGKPITKQSADGSAILRVIPQPKQAEYLLAREELDKEYSDVVVGASAHQAAFAQLLREEVEIQNIRTISLRELPADGITNQVMNLIFMFVEDDEPPAVKETKKPEKPER